MGATYEVIKNAYYRTRGPVPALQGNVPISNPHAPSLEMIEEVSRFLEANGPERIDPFRSHLEYATKTQDAAKKI